MTVAAAVPAPRTSTSQDQKYLETAQIVPQIIFFPTLNRSSGVLESFNIQFEIRNRLMVSRVREQEVTMSKKKSICSKSVAQG